MPTSSSFSISLHTLVRFRHGDSAEWDRLVQQLQALDVLEDFKAWDAQMRRQLPEDPYIARFVAWLTRAWPWILQCHGLEIVNPNDAFLRDELRAFIARTDANAQAREALLDSLQDEKGQKIPPETRGGIYELCFLPQVIFEWCITTTEWHCQAREDAVKLQQHARSLYNQAQGSFLMPATDKERLREKKETLAAFLDLVYPPEAVVQAWRKQLWITHRLNRRPSIHHMWTLILCDLVDCLADFCPYAYAIDNPQAPPYDAFVTASSLMHYAQPTLWEDNPERIRSRYQAVQYRKKYPVNHSDGVVR